MEKAKKDKRTVLCTVVSGLLLFLPLQLPQLAIISWVCLVPVFYMFFTKDISPKRALKLGIIFSYSFYIPSYYWFLYLYPLDWMGFSNTSSILIIILAWFALATFQSVTLCLIFFLFGLINRKNSFFTPLLFPCLWVVIEYIQGLGEFGFTFNHIYITQYKYLPLIQSASIFGPLFVSFLIVTVNSLIAYGLAKASHKKMFFSAAALIFFVNFLFGSIKFLTYKNPSESITAALIQGNIVSDRKWSQSSMETYEIYYELTMDALSTDNPDIVIWPESAVPVDISVEINYKDAYSDLALKNSITFITGTFNSDKTKTYNAIFTFDKNGNAQTPYYKQQLVPFGEYFPYENVLSLIFPFLKQMNLSSDQISPGDSSRLTSYENSKIGYLICFDSIFPCLARKSVSDGANLIILTTNDSWYKNSLAVYQHNAHAVFRAVENNRYVIRAANTGVSSFIMPTGKIKSHLPPLKTGFLKDSASFIKERTIYSYIGDVIVLFCAAYCIICIFLKIIKHFKKAS